MKLTGNEKPEALIALTLVAIVTMIANAILFYTVLCDEFGIIVGIIILAADFIIGFRTKNLKLEGAAMPTLLVLDAFSLVVLAYLVAISIRDFSSLMIGFLLAMTLVIEFAMGRVLAQVEEAPEVE